MSDYIVVWSGALERAGLCGSLTSYEGPSSLNHAPPPDLRLRDGEIKAMQQAIGVRGRKPTRSRVEAQQARTGPRNKKAQGVERCLGCGTRFEDDVQGGRLRCPSCVKEKERQRQRDLRRQGK